MLDTIINISAELRNDVSKLEPYDQHLLIAIELLDDAVLQFTLPGEKFLSQLQETLQEVLAHKDEILNDTYLTRDDLIKILSLAIHIKSYSTPKEGEWRYADEKDLDKYKLAVKRQPALKNGVVVENPPNEEAIFEALTQMIIKKGQVMPVKTGLSSFFSQISTVDWSPQWFIRNQIIFSYQYDAQFPLKWASYLKNIGYESYNYPSLVQDLVWFNKFLQEYCKLSTFAKKTVFWVLNAPTSYRKYPPYPAKPTADYIDSVYRDLSAVALEQLRSETETKQYEAVNNKAYLQARIDYLKETLQAPSYRKHKEVMATVVVNQNRADFIDSFIKFDKYIQAACVYRHLEEVQKELDEIKLEETFDQETHKLLTSAKTQDIGLWIQLFTNEKIIRAPKTFLADVITDNFQNETGADFSKHSLKKALNPSGIDAPAIKRVREHLTKMLKQLDEL